MSNQPQNKPVATEQELNDILRVRREKLAKLVYDFCQPYEDTVDLDVVRESFVRDAESLRVFELFEETTIITPQALGSPVREDFQRAIAEQVLTGGDTVMSIIEEMQGTYDNALRETWNIPIE